MVLSAFSYFCSPNFPSTDMSSVLVLFVLPQWGSEGQTGSQKLDWVVGSRFQRRSLPGTCVCHWETGRWVSTYSHYNHKVKENDDRACFWSRGENKNSIVIQRLWPFYEAMPKVWENWKECMPCGLVVLEVYRSHLVLLGCLSPCGRWVKEVENNSMSIPKVMLRQWIECF